MYTINVFSLTILSSILFSVEAGSSDWYKNGILYQVYPQSLRDENNDGVGDIQGIIEKFDHFVDAGITAFWLSPIFNSPQVDQGYDISDYYSIYPKYGTTADLKELVTKAHAAGIKILLDFVPNHTSDLHDWFKLSENKTEGYEDFYIWRNSSKGKDAPPNNWVSVFDGSAWEWSETRQEYYMHLFTVHQPELNYRSEKMLKALSDVMTYWLDFGIDGFRVDAVPYLLEDDRYLDEPNYGNCDVLTWDCLNHIYTKDQDGSFDAVYNWRDLVDNYTKTKGGDQRIIITEAYADRNKTLYYYGNEQEGRLGAHFTFNFDFISYLNVNSTPADIQSIVNWWQNSTNVNKTWVRNWVLGNHDNHRVATRLGHPDAYNMLVAAFLPGVGVTYQGEEIAMVNGEVTCEEGNDPKAIINCSTFDQVSRDFERTPFQWDTTTNAGFNAGAKPWLPVSSTYHTNNLELQNVPGQKTHFNFYKNFISFHKKLGKLTASNNYLDERILDSQATDDVYFAYRIVKSIENEYVFMFNMNKTEKILVLDVPLLRDVTEYVVEAIGLNTTKYDIGDTIPVKEGVTLQPGESIIVQVKYS